MLEQEEKKEKKKVEESCTASKPTSAAKNEKEKVPPPTAPVEVATIAVTEDANIPHEVPGNIPDDPLPDILIKPQPDVKSFKVLSRPDGHAVYHCLLLVSILPPVPQDVLSCSRGRSPSPPPGSASPPRT